MTTSSRHDKSRSRPNRRDVGHIAYPSWLLGCLRETGEDLIDLGRGHIVVGDRKRLEELSHQYRGALAASLAVKGGGPTCSAKQATARLPVAYDGKEAMQEWRREA